MSSQHNDAPALYAQRIATCRECPSLAKIIRTCKKCNCVVFFKAAIKSEKCPEGRWENAAKADHGDAF